MTWHRRDHVVGRVGSSALADTRGQIVVSWLLKLIIFGAIFGFLVLEFGAVVVNRLQVGDLAGQTATEAGLVYSSHKSIEEAEARAEDYAEQNGGTFVDLAIDAENNEIDVTIRKKAKTFVIHNISAFDGMVEVEATESAPLR